MLTVYGSIQAGAGVLRGSQHARLHVAGDGQSIDISLGHTGHRFRARLDPCQQKMCTMYCSKVLNAHSLWLHMQASKLMQAYASKPVHPDASYLFLYVA